MPSFLRTVAIPLVADTDADGANSQNAGHLPVPSTDTPSAPSIPRTYHLHDPSVFHNASTDPTQMSMISPYSVSNEGRPAPIMVAQHEARTPVQHSPTREKHSIGFLVSGSETSSPTLSTLSPTRSRYAGSSSQPGSSPSARVHASPRKGSTGGKHYYLQVVQHPQKAAEFGPSSLSRLPLAPPPVVQLIVRDNTGNPIDDEAEIPFLVAHLSIFSADGSRQLDTTPGPGGERLLYGNLVSSPHRLRDLQGKHGIFFLFPDVSVRERGSYQLGVTLMSVARFGPPGVVAVGRPGNVLAHARTRTFDVLSRDNYVAPPTTPLTQYLIRQGVRMPPSVPPMPGTSSR